MKILFNYFPILLAIFMVSCKKQENKVYLEGGTAPVLSSNTTAVTLTPGQESKTAIALNWTNPNYLLTTGISSHNVTYIFEIDTAGANFGSKAKYSTQFTNELAKSFTVGELNNILGNSMLLTFGRQYSLDLRIISAIKPDNVSNSSQFAAQLPSNAIRITATPFAPPPKVAIPDAGTLWIVGDAVNSGWQNPLPAPFDVNQKFTKVSNTVYELTVALKNSGGYKLIQEQGNWGTQYKFLTGNATNGTFEKRDADPAFPAPAEAGNYKLSFNFQTGTFTAVKQ